MKKFFLLTMASLMTVFAMAVGRNDGSSKGNAIDFDWDQGNVHMGGTLWYHVDLSPLYEEDNPSLTLYVTNPSRDKSVEASLTATVAGETDTKHYTVSPHEHQTFSTNASVLVHLHQTEIYLTLTTDGEVRLSAKVFESSDLDETCKQAKELKWDTETTQTKGYAAWWKVDLRNIKDTVAYAKKDAKVTITNIGTGTVNLKAGQSLDCPSSGLTKRNYTLLAGESIEDTIPQSMILSVYPDELYFSIENLEQPVKMKVEMVDRPAVPVIPATEDFVDLHVTDTITSLPYGKTYYRIKVAEMDSLAKYEPEFTYRNVGFSDAKVTVKMAFEVPAYGTTNTSYDLAAGEEQIVVYKKNMIQSLQGTDYIYLLTEVQGDVNLYGRFKHVREGKACKTNIDFNWETGHTQEARTTQWYAVAIAEPKQNKEDIVVHLVNNGAADAKVKASLAFSCPYIDLQEISQTIAAGKEQVRTLKYSTYAMMSDTVWIGLETSQDLKFWVTTKPTQTKEPDYACKQAHSFDWENGIVHEKGEAIWYTINMAEVREKAAKFPTVFVQNLSASNEVKITAELSLECPDSFENQKRSLTIAANGSYSKQLSRNLFENIVNDEIYLLVKSTEDVSIQIRLTEEAAGASCSSAIPFNWVSGATQPANSNLWYAVDLRDVLERGNDIILKVENRDNAKCSGTVGVSYTCPDENPSMMDFTMNPKEVRKVDIQNSMLESLTIDSVIYINVDANTSLRVTIDTVAVEPFEPITGEGLTLIPLQWDVTYTLDVDTVWCVIPKEELDKVRDSEEKVKPVAHLYNLGATTNKVKGEVAFQFPIVKKMMESVITLKAGEHTADTIPLSTFEQFLRHDSIILCVTRPSKSGVFQFRAELIKAFSGNTRKDALPVSLDRLYTQGAHTEMWYKLRTADLKQPNLYNKILHVGAKNAGVGDTEVRVEVYDGLKSDVDLLMERGKKVIKKGESGEHNVPAQAIYGVGDVELYIKVRTTDSIVFSTKFNGEYAAIAPDPEQQKAKLLVPNVEYTIKGDNKAHWYQVCLPYIQNNYRYTELASLTYELDGEATIEGTATFQDTMNCAMPVRSRTINKSGKHYKGTKLLSELLEEAAKKAGYTVSLDETQPAYIDSMLHRFVTKDSVTLYVRFKTNKEIKFKLNGVQKTGEDCLNAMSFDWEHGNVNPKKQQTWYVVALDTTKLYQEGKSLRLHVDNWSETASNDVSASLYFKCGDPSQGDITKTIAAGDSLTKDIALDFIKASSPQLMFIDFHSTEAAHIWLEKVDVKRDTVRVDTTFFVCKGGTVLGHIINADTEWNDTVSNIKDESKLALKDSITTIHAYVLREPKAYDFSSKVDIKRGKVLDLTAADTWLKAQYAADDNDTLQNVTSIKWQYATYATGTPTYVDIDLTNQPKLAAERINVKYIATTECSDEVENLYKNIARDTLPVKECNKYTWPENDSTYILPTIDSAVYAGGANWADSVIYLDLKLDNPARFDLKAIAKYGNRLVLINRYDFAEKGYETDPIYTPGGNVKIEWFEASDPTKVVREGYAHYNDDGTPLVGTFYAVIDIKGSTPCGMLGRTQDLVCAPSAAGIAPALAPSIVMPGEDIKVLNLDPEKETIIRIFTTEGLLQNTYNVRGQETFTIKAANDHGFYLVELLNGEEKSTLRYVVK